MVTKVSQQYITRLEIVTAFVHLREEWELVAGNKSLVETEGSVGLMFGDLALAIGLTPLEQERALGPELINNLQGPFIRTL